jgi:hypothetical protein
MRAPGNVLAFSCRGVALWTAPSRPPRAIRADDVELIENVRGHPYGRLTVLGGGRTLTASYDSARSPELEGLLAWFRRSINASPYPVPETGRDITALPAAWFLTLSHELAHLYEDEPVAWTFAMSGGAFRRGSSALAMVTARELVIACASEHGQDDTVRDRRMIYVPRGRLHSLENAGSRLVIRTDSGACREIVLPPALTSWLHDRL